jgi:hypothetical protein
MVLFGEVASIFSFGRGRELDKTTWKRECSFWRLIAVVTRKTPMKRALWVGILVLVVGSRADIAHAQNPDFEPRYRNLKLKTDFDPDPVVVNVLAGGNIKTERGGFEHWVSEQPDVRLNFTAGKWTLTIYADCDADSTLLIRLPNGTWVGNNDGPNTGKNPVLRFGVPQTGTYDIWIGATDGTKTPPARLFITELKK